MQSLIYMKPEALLRGQVEGHLVAFTQIPWSFHFTRHYSFNTIGVRQHIALGHCWLLAQHFNYVADLLFTKYFVSII